MTETHRPTLLVVDDTETNIDILVDTLGEDYEVSVAMDGEGALDVVDSEPPDLILLDIMMPGMDGYEVCRRLKESEATREIPVIFVTALGDVADEVKGFELGAVDYITKPISPSRVQARVRTHLALREAMRRLAAQNEQLVEAARLREDVDGIMRHDLKTPLNSICGLPQLIVRQADLSPEHTELIKTIESAGYRMLNMINLSLDLMKMERGTYPFAPAVVDAAGLIRKIAGELETLAGARGVDIRIMVNGKADDRSPFFILGEELLCYSMFANLIKNAVEAAPDAGTVTIGMADAGGGSVSIHNAGTVPEAIRERFFEKYATAGKSGGTGLGTYSARLIAETQNGTIHMETSDSAGTTISVRLPVAAPDAVAADSPTGSTAATPQAEAPLGLSGRSILLVDDDAFNIMLLKNHLKETGAVLDSAENGRMALEKIRSAAYDLVFMDMEMPVLNGVEAMVRVRRLEAAAGGGHGRIAAVVLSAHDDAATRDKCMAAGFDAYLKKPVNKGDLIGEIRRFFPDAGKAVPRDRFPPEESRSEVEDVTETEFTVAVDEDLADLIPDFLETKRAELAELRNRLAQGDFEGVRQLGHKMKGTFTMYGFGFLSDRCLAIEAAAPQGDGETVRSELGRIDDFMERLVIRYVAEE